MEQPQEHKWRIDRNINIVDLVTMAVLCLGAVSYVNRIETRVALVESQQAVQKDRDDRQDKALTDSLALLRDSITRLDAKLDRLIEGKVKP